MIYHPPNLEGQIKFGGVQGSGKTTIVAKLRESLAEKGLDVPVIKGSAIMAALLECEPDEIAMQDPQLRANARKLMFDQIAQIPAGIRDGHFTVPDGRGGYEPSDDTIDATRGLVIVTATAEEVRQRRIETGRQQRELDLGAIRAQQEIEMIYAIESASAQGIALHHFDNTYPLNSPQTTQAIEGLVAFTCDTIVQRPSQLSRL